MKESKEEFHTEFEILVIDGVEYQTRLTKKFNQRVPYSPLNLGLVTAFIPGTIIDVFVKDGAKVKAGDTIVVLEAMKMLNQLKSPFDAVVVKVNVSPGERVVKNYVLVELKELKATVPEEII